MHAKAVSAPAACATGAGSTRGATVPRAPLCESSTPNTRLSPIPQHPPSPPPAAGLAAERCKVGAGTGEVPPRPHVAAARGTVPKARGGQVTVSGARGSRHP